MPEFVEELVVYALCEAALAIDNKLEELGVSRCDRLVSLLSSLVRLVLRGLPIHSHPFIYLPLTENPSMKSSVTHKHSSIILNTVSYVSSRRMAFVAQIRSLIIQRCIKSSNVLASLPSK